MIRVRWPWARRADTEYRLRLDAEMRRDKVQADWAPIWTHLHETEDEGRLNGWTGAITAIFRGHK